MRSWTYVLGPILVAGLASGCSVIVGSTIDDNAPGGDSGTSDAGTRDTGGRDTGGGGDCTDSSQCDDDNPCNGVETCEMGECRNGPRPVDGTECAVDPSVPDELGICLMDTCDFSQCGDGYIDRVFDEVCDDGNLEDGDGCDSDCQFTCVTNEDCEDDFPCDGVARCLPDNVCDESLLPPPGTLCSTPTVPNGSCNTTTGLCCDSTGGRCCDANDFCG